MICRCECLYKGSTLLVLPQIKPQFSDHWTKVGTGNNDIFLLILSLYLYLCTNVQNVWLFLANRRPARVPRRYHWFSKAITTNTKKIYTSWNWIKTWHMCWNMSRYTSISYCLLMWKHFFWLFVVLLKRIEWCGFVFVVMSQKLKSQLEDEWYIR